MGRPRRLSVDELSKYLRPMLEGMLIWAGDTKNRFKLKVRVIVERLSRRCGFDAVSEAMPASDTRLLTHIRKEHARKQRRREDEAMSVASKATKSSMARTARASEWDASKIFSDGRGTSVGASTAVRGRGAGGRQMRGEEGDPMDLLEGGAGRRMRAAVGGQQEEEDADMVSVRLFESGGRGSGHPSGPATAKSYPIRLLNVAVPSEVTEISRAAGLRARHGREARDLRRGREAGEGRRGL